MTASPTTTASQLTADRRRTDDVRRLLDASEVRLRVDVEVLRDFLSRTRWKDSTATGYLAFADAEPASTQDFFGEVQLRLRPTERHRVSVSMGAGAQPIELADAGILPAWLDPTGLATVDDLLAKGMPITAEIHGRLKHEHIAEAVFAPGLLTDELEDELVEAAIPWREVHPQDGDSRTVIPGSRYPVTGFSFLGSRNWGLVASAGQDYATSFDAAVSDAVSSTGAKPSGQALGATVQSMTQSEKGAWSTADARAAQTAEAENVEAMQAGADLCMSVPPPTAVAQPQPTWTIDTNLAQGPLEGAAATEHFTSTVAKLTAAQAAAVKHYIGSPALNSLLRRGVTTLAEAEARDLDLDKVGEALGFIDEISGAMTPTTKPARVLRGLNAEKAFGTTDLDSLVGTTHVNQGFMSTTTSDAVAQKFGNKFGNEDWRAVLSIDVPVGTPALWIGGINEDELLLAAGTSLRIVGVTGDVVHAIVVAG